MRRILFPRAKDMHPQRQLSLGVLVLFSLLVVGIAFLHSSKFVGYSYRQDEAWSVHWSIVHAEREGGLLRVALDNLTSFASEYFPVEVWVALFGQAEPVTRLLSTLLTALTLALLYRLASDLFNAQTGLFAVFVLGTLAFFQFFSHEVRPYPALIAGVTALMLLFERWLVYRRTRYLIIYGVVAVATIYIHLYVIYVIAAQALYFLLFVRWNRRFFLQTGSAFAITALLLLPRVLIVLFAYPEGGIHWYNLRTNAEGVTLLHTQMQIAPAALGQFLLLLGVTLPVRRYFPRLQHALALRLPFAADWRKLYLVVLPLAVLLLAFAANLFVSNVTPRNLIVILPPLAILVGYAIVMLHWQARVIILLLIAIPALTTFEIYVSNGPYLHMTRFIESEYEPGDRFLVEGAQLWENVPLAYYIRERLPERIENDRLFHLMSDSELALGFMPELPVYRANDASAASREQFRAFVSGSERIWHVKSSSVGFDGAYREILEDEYIPFRTQSWWGEHAVTEYRRIPDPLTNAYVFGSNFQLKHWELASTVIAPCETITLESWWSVQEKPALNYSLSLVLVGEDGLGLTRTDSPPANILTQLWQPNQLYLDVRSLTVPCDLDAGDYPLLVSLYDYETVETLPITLENGTPQAAGFLTTVRVQR